MHPMIGIANLFIPINGRYFFLNSFIIFLNKIVSLLLSAFSQRSYHQKNRLKIHCIYLIFLFASLKAINNLLSSSFIFLLPTVFILFFSFFLSEIVGAGANCESFKYFFSSSFSFSPSYSSVSCWLCESLDSLFLSLTL